MYHLQPWYLCINKTEIHRSVYCINMKTVQPGLPKGQEKTGFFQRSLRLLALLHHCMQEAYRNILVYILYFVMKQRSEKAHQPYCWEVREV